jgi:hypothetical protein
MFTETSDPTHSLHIDAIRWPMRATPQPISRTRSFDVRPVSRAMSSAEE